MIYTTLENDPRTIRTTSFFIFQRTRDIRYYATPLRSGIENINIKF